MKNLKKTIIMSASALAILVAVPAIADDRSEYNADNMPHVTKQDVKEGWKDTKKAVKDTAMDVSDNIENAYDSTKETFVDMTQTHNIEKRTTVSGMLDQPVYDQTGERVAKIHDIMLDEDGDAHMIVLSDGDWTGLGKQVAYQYNILTERSTNGDLITPLSEKLIDQAVAFDYESVDGKLISARELLDADLYNAESRSVAEIDNISLKNGEADQLILGFDKFLGMGGEQASIAFNEVALKEKTNGQIAFQLNTEQSDDFQTMKKQL